MIAITKGDTSPSQNVTKQFSSVNHFPKVKWVFSMKAQVQYCLTSTPCDLDCEMLSFRKLYRFTSITLLSYAAQELIPQLRS